MGGVSSAQLRRQHGPGWHGTGITTWDKGAAACRLQLRCCSQHNTGNRRAQRTAANNGIHTPTSECVANPQQFQRERTLCQLWFLLLALEDIFRTGYPIIRVPRNSPHSKHPHGPHHSGSSSSTTVEKRVWNTTNGCRRRC